MAGETNKYHNVLDKGTLVPIGAVAAVFMSMFAGWQYLDAKFDEVGEKLSTQERRMERIEDSMQRGLTDHWTYTDMRLWVSEAQRENPNLKLPDASR